MRMMTASSYYPILPWKEAERRVFAKLRPQISRRVHPVFDVPPPGEYDHEARRVLLPQEYFKRFGKRLSAIAGRRGAFVDARLLEDVQLSRSSSLDLPEFQFRLGDEHPLTVLANSARQAGAYIHPVSALDRSSRYQAAVRNLLKYNDHLQFCLRVGPEHISDPDFHSRLAAMLNEVRATPDRTVFILDFGPNIVPPISELASGIVEVINSLPELYSWKEIVISSTAFPDKDKLKAGQIKRFRRWDWDLYEELFKNRSEILRFPQYSDYLTEFPKYNTPANIAPTAIIRYIDEKDFIVCKGATTKIVVDGRESRDFSVIRPVAQKLVDEGSFMGSEFSRGDQYFSFWAAGQGGYGKAPVWKWAGYDHYVELVMKQLAGLAPVPTDELV